MEGGGGETGNETENGLNAVKTYVECGPPKKEENKLTISNGCTKGGSLTWNWSLRTKKDALSK